MANKHMGRLYLRSHSGLYKLATIKAGSDGSIYIGAPLGDAVKDKGIRSNKFTYHSDGRSWMTSDLRLEDIEASVLTETRRKLEDWRAIGLGFKNNKLYTKDFEVGVSLLDIREMINLKFGMSYSDVKTIDTKGVLAKATGQQKISTATVIDGRRYTNLTLHFYLVQRQYLQHGLQQFGTKEVYYWAHPALKLYVVTALTDEWAGKKKQGTGDS